MTQPTLSITERASKAVGIITNEVPGMGYFGMVQEVGEDFAVTRWEEKFEVYRVSNEGRRRIQVQNLLPFGYIIQLLVERQVWYLTPLWISSEDQRQRGVFQPRFKFVWWNDGRLQSMEIFLNWETKVTYTFGRGRRSTTKDGDQEILDQFNLPEKLLFRDCKSLLGREIPWTINFAEKAEELFKASELEEVAQEAEKEFQGALALPPWYELARRLPPHNHMVDPVEEALYSYFNAVKTRLEYRKLNPRRFTRVFWDVLEELVEFYPILDRLVWEGIQSWMSLIIDDPEYLVAVYHEIDVWTREHGAPDVPRIPEGE